MVASTLGLLRMPDLYTRMHCQTKGVTLGIVNLMLASVFALQTTSVTIKALFAVLFYFLSNPVGAHMVARASYHHLQVPFWKKTFAEEWKETIHDWNH